MCNCIQSKRNTNWICVFFLLRRPHRYDVVVVFCFLSWIKLMRSLFIRHEGMACNCFYSDNSLLTVKQQYSCLDSIAQYFHIRRSAIFCKISEIECVHISCQRVRHSRVPRNRPPTQKLLSIFSMILTNIWCTLYTVHR